ncbi:hypothetical protein [Shumkonia mesophila]|uniref:hypothetical protein n=1 Tax=Shumkonia mesophila TaxID=2838854 RepID=UPI002935088A|nr:hypothetical protein [Shumkonia mesophila]
MIEKITVPHLSSLPHIASDRRTGLPERLLRVIAELTKQIERENADLATGFPALMTPGIERKHELADAYVELYGELHETAPGFLSLPDDLAERMISAILRLREVTNENLARLDAAMAASRQRIQAALAAARDAQRQQGTYSAKGEVPLRANLTAFGGDYHA